MTSQSTTQYGKTSVLIRLLLSAFLIVWIVLAAFPFLWTLWGSFKVEADFFSKVDWTLAISGERTIAETGSAFTGAGYYGAWVQEEFWRAALNTMIVTTFVVIISLTLGTLGGYALSRSGFRYTFCLLYTSDAADE